MGMPVYSLGKRCVAEGVGTFILVFFGCGAVHAAVLTGAQSGLWQGAVVWGGGVAGAAHVGGGVSGAHINPPPPGGPAARGRISGQDGLPSVPPQLARCVLSP